MIKYICLIVTILALLGSAGVQIYQRGWNDGFDSMKKICNETGAD
jgi:hypothetical protein